MEFARIIAACYGEAGQAFLRGLSEELERTLREWGLALERIHEPLGYGFVAYVRDSSGWPAVLKLGVDPDEIEAKAHYLRALGPELAVRVLRSEGRATLLERALPGTRLSALGPAREREATRAFADLASRIAALGVVGGPWDRLEDWMSQVRTCVESPKVRASLAGGAMALAAARGTALLAEGRDQVVLHGDLHHDNILLTSEGWRLIDPKGVLGDPGFEVGAFMHNPGSMLFRLRTWTAPYARG